MQPVRVCMSRHSPRPQQMTACLPPLGTLRGWPSAWPGLMLYAACCCPSCRRTAGPAWAAVYDNDDLCSWPHLCAVFVKITRDAGVRLTAFA